MPSLYETTPETGTVSTTNLTSLYSNTTDFTTGVVSSAVSSVSGGTGVTVNPTTGNVVVSIGQAVSTASNVTFANVTATGNLSNAYYTLANAVGSAGQVLTTNGGGATSWTSVSGLGLVNSVTGSGAGISVSPTTGAVVVSNTGVTSIVAGTNVTVSGATGAVTVNATDTNTTYNIDASSTTGGANLNLTGSDASTDTVKFAEGTGITVTRTDANTITITNSSPGSAGVTSITGTANQVIASASTGAVTLSTPQSIATTSTPTFASLTTTGDVAVNGGDLTTTQTTASVFNTTATTVNAFGAATTLNLGAAFPGITTIKGDGVVDGDFTVNADIIIINGDKTNLPVYLNFGRVAPNNNAAIRWNNSTNKFEFSADSSTWSPFVQTLDDLSDVVITTPGQGNLFYYNGTNFVNSSTIATSVGGNRPVFQYDNTGAGINSVLTMRKNRGATPFADGDGPGFKFEVDSDSQAANEFALISGTYNSTQPSINFSTSIDDGANYITNMTTGNFGVDVWQSELSLNRAQSGVPALDAYITADRGSSANVSLRWNETTDRWQFTNDGTTFYDMADNSGHIFGNVTVGVDTAQTISTTSGNLVLQTAAGVNAGTMTLTAGANGNLTLAPNGTGSVALTLANGGNLTNTRNYVQGAIRNSTSAAAGDIWTFGPGGSGYRGISLDNSADTTKGPETLARSFSGGAVNGNAVRPRVVLEKARGTSASPTAVQSADQLGSVEATGYTSTGWVADLVAAPTGTQVFTASENWVGTTNLGTQYTLALAPTATTITSGASLTPVILVNPQGLSLRSDAFAIAKGKTSAFTATGSSISGTTLTIGTVTSGTVAVGQLLTGANITSFGVYIVRNLTGSGSGSTWTVSQTVTAASGTITGAAGFVGSDGTTLDALATPRLLTNVIKNSGGSDVVTMTSGNTNTTVNTTLLSLFNPTTQTTYGGASNMLINAGNPAAAGFNDRISQLRVQTATTSGSEASTITFNTGNYNTGTNVFSATQSGDYLGEFFFAGNYGTTSAFTTLGPSVRFRATAAENFTATNSGGAFAINLDKIGGSTPYDAISINSSNAVIASDALALNDNTGTGLVGSSKISYNRVYGQWQYDATITPAAANTAYAFQWQGGSAVTDYANIASATNTSRIQPNAVGFYNLQFSVQLSNTDNAADHTAYIWWRKNGTDIAGSMGRVYVTKQHQTISAWNNLVQATASTDYFELMYAVDNVALVFPYFAATAFGPSTAAAFISLTPVGA